MIIDSTSWNLFCKRSVYCCLLATFIHYDNQFKFSFKKIKYGNKLLSNIFFFYLNLTYLECLNKGEKTNEWYLFLLDVNCCAS